MISRGMPITVGLLLMVTVTAMWGVSFLTPVVLSGYTPIDITIGRYVFYGVVSVAFWLWRYRAQKVRGEMWTMAVVYAVTGNLGFSVLVSYGIQTAGPIVSIPIIGMLPLIVAIFGNASLSELPWVRLWVPLAVIAAGLFVVLGTESGLFSAHAVETSWSGVGAIVLTILMWTWFAISNARFLRGNKDIDGGAWSCLVGMATLLISLLWEAASAMLEPGSTLTAKLAVRDDYLAFVGLTSFLGIGASWAAGWLFNKASINLPMNLVGQLIVLETVFGIFYVYLYERHLPPPIELAGMCGILAGITLSIRTIKKRELEEAQIAPAATS